MLFKSHLCVQNILDGVIWFCLPVLLVCANDTWAYICGFFLGKRFINQPLTKLSVRSAAVSPFYNFFSPRKAGRVSWVVLSARWFGASSFRGFWLAFRFSRVLCASTPTGMFYRPVKLPITLFLSSTLSRFSSVLCLASLESERYEIKSNLPWLQVVKRDFFSP